MIFLMLITSGKGEGKKSENERHDYKFISEWTHLKKIKQFKPNLSCL